MMTRNAGTRFIDKEKIKDKDMMITKNYIAKGEGANRFEKIPVQIYETADEAVKAVAVRLWIWYKRKRLAVKSAF